MDGRRIFIDELERGLSEKPQIESASTQNPTVNTHTATVYKPHFAVSSLTLLRFTCQERGTTRSVTMYRLVSV